MSEYNPTKITVVTAFTIGIVMGGLVVMFTNSSGYRTGCSDLQETRVIPYSGMVSDYNHPDLESDIVINSRTRNGGIMILSSDKLAVENDSEIHFGFKERIHLDCSKGRINVQTHFIDIELQDVDSTTGDSK